MPLWYDLLHMTKPEGGHGFSFRGAEIFYRCLVCDATFPQTDEGWRELSLHGMDAHEQPTTFDWRELQGKTVTFAVIERELPDSSGMKAALGTRIQTDILARADDGTVYFMPDPTNGFGGTSRGWKCKPRSQESNLLQLMQGDPALPSNG